MAKKKASRKPAAKKKARTKGKARSKRASSPPSTPNPALNGWITHTELVSADPDATKEWCVKALGWTFRPSFPMQDGSLYHLFMYSNKGGGGIRANNSPEVPGSVPYIQVGSIQAAYDKAIRAGAEEMMAPAMVMEDLWIAIVRAPGGVPIGLAGPKKK